MVPVTFRSDADVEDDPFLQRGERGAAPSYVDPPVGLPGDSVNAVKLVLFRPVFLEL